MLYWGSLSKEYPLHHNHTHPTKFSSEFRKLHIRDYSIVLKSDKNRVPFYLRVAFLASELFLYLHILIYMFYSLFFWCVVSTKWGLNFWTEPRSECTITFKKMTGNSQINFLVFFLKVNNNSYSIRSIGCKRKKRSVIIMWSQKQTPHFKYSITLRS